jgi:2-polyprenyl-3-methyl-5-hydroxy-6-metoxy-1,4-benzoquinol methylase
VGCGDGDLAVELWRRGAVVTGIDASPDMIDAARARGAREARTCRSWLARRHAPPSTLNASMLS